MITNNLLPLFEDLNYEILPKHTRVNPKLEKYFPPAIAIKFKIPVNVKPIRTARENHDRLLYNTKVNA
jgi:hypothetical protein